MNILILGVSGLVGLPEDKIDKYYLALRSIRDEIPQDYLSNLLG